MLQTLLSINIKWILRDRILHALVGLSLMLLVLVPAASSFSMRQVQELSITLSLSLSSFVLLILTIILSASSIWRDIEKRYTSIVLAVPHGRGVYLLGKFFSIVLSIVVATLLLGIISCIAIAISAAGSPSATAIRWSFIVLALMTDCLKYILLAAIAVLISTVSTSFFLPFFGTVSIFVAGSASQGVFDYVSGELGSKIGLLSRTTIEFVYYLLPNFGAFNYKLYAIYPVPFSFSGLLQMSSYFCIYTALVLSLAVWVFSRRELL